MEISRSRYCDVGFSCSPLNLNEPSLTKNELFDIVQTLTKGLTSRTECFEYGC